MEETTSPINQKCYIKLMKMTKCYNWEVKVFDDDLEVCKKLIKQQDDWLRENYGGEE